MGISSRKDDFNVTNVNGWTIEEARKESKYKNRGHGTRWRYKNSNRTVYMAYSG